MLLPVHLPLLASPLARTVPFADTARYRPVKELTSLTLLWFSGSGVLRAAVSTVVHAVTNIIRPTVNWKRNKDDTSGELEMLLFAMIVRFQT